MQLIYRGQAFNYSPLNASSAPAKTGVSRTLFYHGATYHCQLATMQLTRLPNAINWRFAGASERQHQSLSPAH